MFLCMYITFNGVKTRTKIPNVVWVVDPILLIWSFFGCFDGNVVFEGIAQLHTKSQVCLQQSIDHELHLPFVIDNSMCLLEWVVPIPNEDIFNKLVDDPIHPTPMSSSLGLFQDCLEIGVIVFYGGIGVMSNVWQTLTSNNHIFVLSSHWSFT